MSDISIQHRPNLDYHIRQAAAWLAISGEGGNTAMLSYAALELRYAIERLGVHYWTALLNRDIEAHDLYDIESFKRIERRIYELAGHQKEIDRHFEFMRIVLLALKIDSPFQTPQIGKLSNYWHECSELCHIGWPLASAVPEAQKAAFTNLSAILEALSAHVNSLGWPILKDEAFEDLRNRFIAGNASSEDVIAYIQTIGLWARAEFPDGTAEFVGEPVAPAPQNKA
jgi:hypothetical protein